MADEVSDFLRMSFVRPNERIDRIEGQIAGICGMYATLSSRMDRVDRRLERIERRLYLVDAQA